MLIFRNLYLWHLSGIYFRNKNQQDAVKTNIHSYFNWPFNGKFIERPTKMELKSMHFVCNRKQCQFKRLRNSGKTVVGRTESIKTKFITRS